MGPIAGESGLTAPRLFLVAPDAPVAHLAACLKAACAAGDVASLLVPLAVAKELTPVAQALGVAVLTTGEPRDAMRAGCDGLHLDAEADDIAEARNSIGKDRIIGAFAGASRHFAMQAAEAGADYVALSQNGASIGGEPIVKWWGELAEIPCVAFDPVDASALDTLLPQKPDFIRPASAMWENPDKARGIVSELMQRLKA